jgi:outer membrane receptor for ferric coprogen and ferric-rhodotorulic acid
MTHPRSARSTAFSASSASKPVASTASLTVFSPRLKPSVRLVRGAIIVMAAAVVIANVPAATAFAAEPGVSTSAQKSYNIPAGPLSPALSAFAGSAGVNLSSEPALTDGLRTQGLQGSFTVQEGFTRLLAGSGLTAVARGGNVYTLSKLPPSSSIAPHEATLPAVTATAAVTPTTEGSDSYTTRALTIGKMTQSIRETPQSVTVVTRKQMDDQNLVTLDQVLEHTTGITKSQRNFGAHVYTIRGYVIPETNYLIDGVSGNVYNPTGWVPTDMAVFDRVEVLRGAGGLIVGAGDPSGVINMVRKRPKAEKHFDVTARVGSWNNYRMEVDAGGTLNEAGTVRGRVVAAYQDNKFFYDVAHSKAPLVYGVIDMDLGRDTTLTVGVRHQETNIDGYAIYGLPRFTNGAALNVPRSTSFTQAWNRHEASTDEVFTELEHRFAGDWKAKLTATYSKTSIYQKLGRMRGAVNPAVGTTNVERSYFMNHEVPSYGIDANASGSFQAWGRTHQAMFGANWSKSTTWVRTATSDLPAVGTMSIYNPNPWLLAEPAQPAWANRSVNRDDRFGIYGSTRWELADDLHMLLGGRVSWFAAQSQNLVTNKLTNDYKQNAEFTPYAGLVYDLSKEWSVYTSYADTFEPQSRYQTASGVPLKPAIGSNVEAGIKGELYDGRLNITMSVFQAKKKNVAIEDPATAGLCPGVSTNNCFRTAAFRDSRGFEIEVGGQLAKGWQATAGYTRLKNEDENGQTTSWETPKHLFRASTTYRLPGELQKWSIGGGVIAQSDYYYKEPSGVEITQGGYSVWNAFASYKISDKWTASLNIDNLFDKHYFAVVGGTLNGGYFGTPRNVMLTMRGSF